MTDATNGPDQVLIQYWNLVERFWKEHEAAEEARALDDEGISAYTAARGRRNRAKNAVMAWRQENPGSAAELLNMLLECHHINFRTLENLKKAAAKQAQEGDSTLLDAIVKAVAQ